MGLTERRCKGVDWIYLAVDRLFERREGKREYLKGCQRLEAE